MNAYEVGFAVGMAKQAGIGSALAKILGGPSLVAPGFGKRFIMRNIGPQGLSRVQRYTGKGPMAATNQQGKVMKLIERLSGTKPSGMSAQEIGGHYFSPGFSEQMRKILG